MCVVIYYITVSVLMYHYIVYIVLYGRLMFAVYLCMFVSVDYIA